MAKTCFDSSEYVVYQPYPGLHVVYHARRVLFRGQSRFQRIEIIDNEAYGLTLLLDGNIQHTEFDSHIFNRALVGPILRKGMRNVLVLGGGSGQSLKALLRSKSIESVTVVEIDQLVVDACRAHIPGVKEAFEDPRVKLVIDDAFKFIREGEERYDALVLDLTEEWLGQSVGLDELYQFVATRCGGCCSCYIGPASPQTGGAERRRRHLLAAKKFLNGVRVRKVFIPSFGSEQLFLYGGGL